MTPSRTWTAAMDRVRLAMQARGKSASQIGEKLGVSRNAVIGRSWRLSPSYEKKMAALRLATEQRRCARDVHERIVLDQMVDAIRRGVARNIAIRAAVKSGARYTVIAAMFGVTKQRIWQIVGLPRGKVGAPRRGPESRPLLAGAA